MKNKLDIIGSILIVLLFSLYIGMMIVFNQVMAERVIAGVCIDGVVKVIHRDNTVTILKDINGNDIKC